MPLVDRPRSTSALQFGDDNDEGKAEDTVSEQRIGDINRNGAAARPSRKTSSSIRDTEEARLIPNCQITAISSIGPAAPPLKARARESERPSNIYSRATNIAFTLRCKCATQIDANLDHLVVKPLFHRDYDKMSLPRKLTNMNSLISSSQSNSRQRASCPQSRPTKSHLPFFAKTKDRTHAMNPTQAVSKNEMRAARRVDNLANQSHSKRGREQQAGSGVQTSKLAPSAPSIPEPTPRPILKFARPTPIPNPPHPKNATTKNQETAHILTTPQRNVKTNCRVL